MSSYREIMQNAENRGAKVSAFIAMILVEEEMLEGDTAEDICYVFGMSHNYAHLVRSVQRVGGELARLGYKLTTID